MFAVKEKYDNMYSAGPAEQERLEKEFEQEVADLLKTSSVLELAVCRRWNIYYSRGDSKV